MTITLRQRIAAKMDNLAPRYECIQCNQPTRSPDFMCPACWRQASTTANRMPRLPRQPRKD